MSYIVVTHKLHTESELDYSIEVLGLQLVLSTTMQNSSYKVFFIYLFFLPILLGVTAYIFQPYYIEHIPSCLLSLLMTLIIAVFGYKRKSLSIDGAMYSVIVGHTLSFANAGFFSCLLVFFLTGSKLTKYKSRLKFSHLGQEHITGGKRTCLQVLCNGSVSTICAMGYILFGGQGIIRRMTQAPIYYEVVRSLPFYMKPSTFEMGVIVSLASACGDTWASEIGSAKGGNPKLITRPFGKDVPIGTNGGVTLYGTVASFFGGAIIGVAYISAFVPVICYEFYYSKDHLINLDLHLFYQTFVFISFTGVIGFIGSLVDSIIGCIFQYSGINVKTNKVSEYKSECKEHISGWSILDNNMVNLVSIALVTLVYVCVAQAIL